MNSHEIIGLMFLIKLEHPFHNHAHMRNSVVKSLTQACCDYGLGLGPIFVPFGWEFWASMALLQASRLIEVGA